MVEDAWYYFLSIEKDFARTIDFVHLNLTNFKTYSNEYAKLLLLIGSEVDVIAKRICKKANGNARAENIEDYRKVITTTFRDMHTVEIDIARFALKIRPWADWGNAQPQSPAWWKAYNNVKHERDKNFADANQENALNALCGLCALLLYLFKDEPHLQPYPELLDHGFPNYLVGAGSDKKLPGL
jgi:hypothetical protein